MPEKDLSILLNSVNPRLGKPDYVFCTLSLEKYNSLEELPKFAPQTNGSNSFASTTIY